MIMKRPKLIPFAFSTFSALAINIACQSSSDKQSGKQDTVSMIEKEHSETKLTEVPFAIAKNYFVKNDASPSETAVIKTKEEFDKIFGAAAVMGEQGTPTPIDFDKQFVIAVVIEPTEFSTTIEPLDLKVDGGKIKHRYSVHITQKELHISHPAMILIVDKKHEAPVVFERLDQA